MKRKILTVLAVCLAITLTAQQPEQQADEAAQRAQEREVKTSGNYLYGEAVGNTKNEATKAAKAILVSEINKEIINRKDWEYATEIQAKDVEYTDMIDLMRGNKFRVIAYIKKENLTAVFKNKAPGIKMTDQKPVKEPKEPKQPKEAQEPKEPQPAAEVTPTTTEVQPVSENRQHTATGGGDLLDRIVNAASLNEIQTILVDSKKKGHLVHGTLDKLTNPEAAYLIVYKSNGAIVAILDKEANGRRKDFISGETFGNEILNNNLTVWFQIFNNK